MRLDYHVARHGVIHVFPSCPEHLTPLVLRLFSTVLSRVLHEDKELKVEEFEASHTLVSHTLAGEGGIQGEGRGEEARGLGRGGEGVQIFLTTQTRTLSDGMDNKHIIQLPDVFPPFTSCSYDGVGVNSIITVLDTTYTRHPCVFLSLVSGSTKHTR